MENKKIQIFESADGTQMTIFLVNDNKVLFSGNFWDFIREAKTFQELFEKIGFEVEVHKYTFEKK